MELTAREFLGSLRIASSLYDMVLLGTLLPKPEGPVPKWFESVKYVNPDAEHTGFHEVIMRKGIYFRVSSNRQYINIIDEKGRQRGFVFMGDVKAPPHIKFFKRYQIDIDSNGDWVVIDGGREVLYKSLLVGEEGVEDCESWLNIRYPDAEDVSAYWR